MCFLVSVTITRDCYSSFRGMRTDIPPDHYEGCRKAALDPHLANYVNNTVKEYDVRRNYYDSTEFCFCFLDHRCNDSNKLSKNVGMILIANVILVLLLLK